MVKYLAYGSNLNLAQMAYRCPNSRVYGTAVLKDYRLAFHGRSGNAHATIIKKKGESIPVLIWDVPEEDEKSLDRYEGYPRYYFKKNVKAVMDTGETVTAMVYIMDTKCVPNLPSSMYVDTIAEGYEDCDFDIGYLKKALEENIIEVDKKKKFCPRCYSYYSGEPAISRKNNDEICPTCGMKEALNAFLDYIDNQAANA